MNARLSAALLLSLSWLASATAADTGRMLELDYARRLAALVANLKVGDQNTVDYAMARLQELADDNRLTDYPRAQAMQILLNAYLATGRFEWMRATGVMLLRLPDALNAEERANVELQMARSYLQEQNWQQGRVELQSWLARHAANRKPSALFWLALCHYHLQDIDNARATLEEAVAAQRLFGTADKEHLLMLSVLYLQQRQLPEAETVLAELASRYPDDAGVQEQLAALRK